MIPTVILLGLLLGRWPVIAIVTAVVGWPVVLVASDVMTIEAGLVGAAGLAFANVVVGVVVHQAGLRGIRHLRRRSRTARPTQSPTVPPITSN